MSLYVGIDFGTTNSALAVADAEGTTSLARFARAPAGYTDTFRSVLHFDPERRGATTGPGAIEAYLEGNGDGRLIQSLKSYLASKTFSATSIFNRTYTLEDMIAIILRGVRSGAAVQFPELATEAQAVVVGRPVRFSNAEDDTDDALAVSRLTAAFAKAGWDKIAFEYEPVAAAYFYERGLDHDELVLIADFGGGTSDFCLMRLGPSGRRRGRTPADILGTEGVALAGDAFDGELVDRVVSPRLGAGSEYKSYLGGKVMRVPSWIFSKLRRWHHLSFLKSKETMHFLGELRAQTLAPEKIEALLHVVEQDLGYQMYQAVERSKMELSDGETSRFQFRDLPVDIQAQVARPEFEGWIAEELDAIRAAVERLLTATGVAAGDVDRVFMTGGSSFVPSVRRIFEERFGRERLRGGNELTSVARGLALRARDLAG